MDCQHCGGKGTIAKSLGAGIYFFGPCEKCYVHDFHNHRAGHGHKNNTHGTNNSPDNQRDWLLSRQT